MGCDCSECEPDEYRQDQAYFEREMIDTFKVKIKDTLENVIQNAWSEDNKCLYCSVFVEQNHKEGCIILSVEERLDELKELNYYKQ